MHGFDAGDNCSLMDCLICRMKLCVYIEVERFEKILGNEWKISRKNNVKRPVLMLTITLNVSINFHDNTRGERLVLVFFRLVLFFHIYLHMILIDTF